ncbi:MAG TPA: hypothetical protein VLE23_10695, partial [Geminicoccaceae bacterium]|nr:hypothetical protein [Geminicoccaceae bacterium]
VGAGFDAEWITSLGREQFNSTTNGNTRYPVVADPDDLQVNQLYLVADGLVPHAALKIGRQRIIWDDERFVGNVGFRQNEQTFDALRATTDLIPQIELEYVYFDEVRRIFGDDSDVGSFDMNAHGIRSRLSGVPFVNLKPFALLLDFENDAPGLSSATFGALVDTDIALVEPWQLHFHGGLAYQEDYAENPDDFDLWYYVVEPGLSYDFVKASLGFEVLEGDGASAFQTPLATGHKFNGLTDQFLTTPPDGLRDLYLKLDLDIPGDGWRDDLTVPIEYHQFWAEDQGTHYGWEWSIGLFKTVPTDVGKVLLGVQYADYDADNFAADTQKLWVTLQFILGPEPYRGLIDSIRRRQGAAVASGLRMATG